MSLTLAVAIAQGHTGKSTVGELATGPKSKNIKKIIACIDDESERAILEQFDKVEVVNIGQPKSADDLPMDLLKSVDEIMLIPPANRDNKFELSKMMVDACAMAGIKRVLCLGMNGAEESGGLESAPPHLAPFLELEQYILSKKDSIPVITCFRANPYMHVVLLYLQQIKEGYLPAPLGDGKCAFLDMDDVGIAASAVMTMSDEEREKLNGKIFKFTGPESLSGDDMARIMSKTTGRDIKFQDISREDAKKILTEEVPDFPLIEAMTILESYDLIREGIMDFVSKDYSQVTGKDPTSFVKFCEDHRLLFTPREE